MCDRWNNYIYHDLFKYQSGFEYSCGSYTLGRSNWDFETLRRGSHRSDSEDMCHTTYRTTPYIENRMSTVIRESVDHSCTFLSLV